MCMCMCVYMHIYIYIYIYREREREREICIHLGWHYLSNATCLIQPHLFYACFVVSRITTLCYMIRHFRRKPALDE